MKVDLHIHSTFSDGSDNVETIVAAAEKKGLDAIAITDHDTASHFTCLSDFSGRPLLVVGGVELSAIQKSSGTRAHILGYCIQKPKIITAFSEPLLKARNKNSEAQVDILAHFGYKVDLAKVARADGRYLYKQHIMGWLVNTGQVPEMFGEFYYKMFKNGGPCQFDIDYYDMCDAVRVIKEAGGLAVLAHPGQQQNFDLVPTLLDAGLNGIELNHHSHSERDRDIVREIAKKYGLFMAGGSDYHGCYEPQPFGIGDFLADESGVKAIWAAKN